MPNLLQEYNKRVDNVSTMLLFPCIKVKQDLVRQFNEFGFIGTYLYCEKYYYDFNVIYVVFKPTEFSMGFYGFTLEMEKNINYVETLDEPGIVIMVYRVPPQFGADYLLFLNGAYSITSPDFKACFKMKEYKQAPDGQLLKTVGGAYVTEYTMYYHIFNKTQFLKDKWLEALGEDTPLPDELYQKCDIKKETLYL